MKRFIKGSMLNFLCLGTVFYGRHMNASWEILQIQTLGKKKPHKMYIH